MTDDFNSKRMTSNSPVTLADIAKLAGVSPVTVSRAINTPALVKPRTLEAIEKVIARTGYVPNLLAGGLASRRTRLIAAIVPSVASTIFAETIEGLNAELVSAGYQLLLGLSGYEPARELELTRAILARRPDGVILTGITHLKETRAMLTGAGLPIVEIWDSTPSPLDTAVGFSHAAVGALVADHLLIRGYDRYAQVGANDPRAVQRRDGFVSRLRGVADVELPDLEMNSPSTFRDGRLAMAQLLDRGKGTLGVFCSSDVVAHGALAEAYARGCRMPDELAIVGFGDFDFAPHTHPPLTTVRIDRRDIGTKAAQSILRKIAGDKNVEAMINIDFHIVVRGTA
ncbi:MULTISPECIES: LacI family DNA-binding transcriptional regulator [unclassified Rhizobium]|jgi:LacI family gluconate utilization system Gnt-I transcriptional repressor|uniref:LacI family DNA-binding transcriptional regulator n=1 Tax=unclassified Rhizobium TaxID=2613769 RepID=UPI001AE6D386|nr:MULTISPECIES: LacI family DNA-binding transcriptional regulator [unclassified Rhizobium]MBP2460081.1 LacI family gluconate utilization system Gnt-I transcriptional repressor [Rhizobium sp. PvP014]MBP2531440.1 LacI family gluconate utilization system Gnt-I transcriptional repressor [Rhizobium sp. PvP099]